jgi:4-amino-4-deoxy-L-arabinose transferase-like glycosyltransferase
MSFPFAFNAWRSLPFVVSLFLLIFTLLVVGNWIGYIASDDAIYLTGAYGLLEEFPYLGGHGTFRFIITGPIALSLSVFGENEVALALPSFFYALALTVLVIHTSKKAFGPLPAVISAGLLVTSPLLVVTSSIASVDVIEAFFVFASVAFFLKSAHMEKFKGQKSVSNLILAGVMAGFAFLTRETTVFLLVFYGFLFLWGIGIKRLHHFIMAAGFFLIWGLESLYFWVFSGDPFYRFTRSVNHDSTIDRTIDVTGNFIVHPVIDPLFVLLFNQEFGFLFWGVIGFGIWWIIQQKQPSHAQQGLELMAQRQSSQGQSDKERSGQEQFGQKQSEQRQVAQQKLDETGQKDVLDALGTSQSSRNDQWFCETAEASIEWQVFTF